MLIELVSIIAPVFACVSIGVFMSVRKYAFDSDAISSLVVTVGTPSLIFTSLTSYDINFGEVGAMIIWMSIMMIMMAAASAILLVALGLSLRGFIPALSIPNAGNVGLPLALFAFGEEGLAFGVACMVATAIAQHSVGKGIASGTYSIGKLMRSPIMISISLSLLAMWGDVEMPAWIANTTRILGGMSIPLLLILLGYSLARLRVAGIWRAAGLAVVRLALGFAIGVGLAAAVGLEGTARGVLIMQASMPVAIFSYVYAYIYKTKSDDVAGMTVVSTLLSFASLPLLLLYVL